MRVAITTARDACTRLAELVRRQGLDPVSLPCIAIVPGADRAFERIRTAVVGADLVMVTSARAVEITWPDGGLDGAAMAVVGPVTAAAARRAGGRVEMVGSQGAAALVARLTSCVSGSTVVFPHSHGSDPSHVRRLREAGAMIVAEEVYRTVPIGPADDPVDAAIFGSPSAVAGWTLSRELGGLAVAAMGRTTAGALARHGRPDAVVPERPGFDGVLAALIRQTEERSTT